MAEAQKSATSEKEVKAGIPEGHEYVTIPRKNLLNWDHPGIGINLKHWGPGTHLVTSEQAGEINRRLEKYNDSVVRILSPTKDRMAEAKSRDFIG